MRFRDVPIALTTVLHFCLPLVTSFTSPSPTIQIQYHATSSSSSLFSSQDSIETTLGGNWMKPSEDSITGLPSEVVTNKDTKDSTVYMDVGIGGQEFGTGPLSKRMFDVMIGVAEKQFGARIPMDVYNMYLLYAMDASAKEAVKAAMSNNGYEMNLGDDLAMQDVSAWGSVESVLLLDPLKGTPIQGEDRASSYSSWEDAIQKGKWMPGDGFSFVIRRVPSLQKAMDLSSVLNALDPDGKLRQEAKEKGMLLPDEDIASLKDLRVDCTQRVNAAPLPVLGEEKVFRGGESKGYNVISRSSLVRNVDGTENAKSMMHVMDALANHGCLIVDLTNEDANFEDAITMSKMWSTVDTFFSNILDKDTIKGIPPMDVAKGVGSSHATIGYASHEDGDNQLKFLETRLRRSDGTLLPEETQDVVGDKGVNSLVDSFHIMSDVGKDIVRIVTAASSIDAEAFVTTGSVVSQKAEGPSIAGLSISEATSSGILDERESPSAADILRGDILASDAAALMALEIMDDGKPLPPINGAFEEEPVSMSPHRLCRYSNDHSNKKYNEVFGGHTDTSFVTIVPAASVSGLEVYDEDEMQWYRPELRARKHAKQLDLKDEMNDKFPWHSRYLIVMPGELLQITSRNNVPAVVHRVVAAQDKSRFSAPILLRARSGTKLDVERYLGSLGKADSLLQECDGMKMEEIHDALQDKR